ncbi:polysaccharide deacetylase family protein [Actinomadura opuntiae]|uniref:polysaccharide deacetylase family protein n=1 Tax=Actinomadura sp. OS1-43 TaxID=604315 RepID=UPI00255AB10E|nr:polysaccharide deacetylase family protein [Actinomadura sp. OS1-43]MDL4815806.1 polysaccharide deacetylase family protein [Actinomadura sp. OS1-43]
MDGPILVRRAAAAVLAATVCGALSTLGPGPQRVGLAAASAPAPVPKHRGSAGAQHGAVARVDCRRVKCVALTFDDGPAESTGRLLDILAAHHVRATFFIVGEQAAKYPELVRREHEAGHQIADHSYTHADLGRASRKKILSELTRTQEAIRRASGITPDMLRPPYGSVSKRLTAITRRMGLAQVLWTVDPLDWEHRDTRYVERRVLKAVRPGYIVLMHDIHPTTVDAVPSIIEKLAARGYAFVTVPELFGGSLTPGEEYVQLKSGDHQGLP